LKLSFSYLYLFLYPVGHLGFTAVTFFVVLPLTQVIEVFFAAAGFVAAGVWAGVGVPSCDSLTLIVGFE
jgi:hypothetical protein